MTSKLNRIGTDLAGYGLILLGALTGWLPGPGGIPLVLAGLGLLSIHNAWARRLRDWLIANGSRLFGSLFPNHPFVQAAYDVIMVLLLVVVVWLAWNHAALWQISLSIALFCLALLIGAMNRHRYSRVKRRITSK